MVRFPPFMRDSGSSRGQRVSLEAFLCDWVRKHDLTLIEEARLLSQAVNDALRYALRQERHGTTEKKADEA